MQLDISQWAHLPRTGVPDPARRGKATLAPNAAGPHLFWQGHLRSFDTATESTGQHPSHTKAPRSGCGGRGSSYRRESPSSVHAAYSLLYCPFPGCPNVHVAQSADALTKHLSRIHVVAGQHIPADLLLQLRQSVCAPCGQLFPISGTCLGCGGTQPPRDVPM